MPRQEVTIGAGETGDYDEVVEIDGSSFTELDTDATSEVTLPEPKVDKEEEAIEIVDAETEAAPPATDKAKPPAEAADGLQIDYEDDTPEDDRGRTPSEPPEPITEKELEGFTRDVQRKIRHYTKVYHDERRVKEAAQRELDALVGRYKHIEQENQALKANTDRANEVLLKQTTVLIERDMEQASNELRNALQAGDSEATVIAQQKLNDAQNRLSKVKSIKPPKTLQPRANGVQSAQDPVNQQPRQQPRATPSQKTQEWTARNQWFGKNEEMTGVALVVHNGLINQGYDTNSDAYYEQLDARLKTFFPKQLGEPEDSKSDKQQAQGRAPNVVAPPSRSTGPRRVTLTKSEKSLAKRLGLTPQQYAQGKLELQQKEARNG